MRQQPQLLPAGSRASGRQSLTRVASVLLNAPTCWPGLLLLWVLRTCPRAPTPMPAPRTTPACHAATVRCRGCRYICAGYSAYDEEGLKQAASKRTSHGDPVQLPYCEGLEIVSAAGMSRKPELLTDGPELSASSSSAGGPPQDAGIRQRPGRSFGE